MSPRLTRSQAALSAGRLREVSVWRGGVIVHASRSRRASRRSDGLTRAPFLGRRRRVALAGADARHLLRLLSARRQRAWKAWPPKSAFANATHPYALAMSAQRRPPARGVGLARRRDRTCEQISSSFAPQRRTDASALPRPATARGARWCGRAAFAPPPVGQASTG